MHAALLDVFLAILVLADARRFRSFIANGLTSFEETSLEEAESVEGKAWVLLVAGSNGWFNYRHQADVCHAYHLTREHGIPKENIITMMYDDIASHSQNPYPGKIFNVPNGSDVYAGVVVDYANIHVTPENFLAVLSGNASGVNGGSGRVIESGPNDHIFVFFSDHGATGLISFPSSILTVKDLNDALRRMHKRKRYAKLVFYLEACESGSMFQKVLPKQINVYAMTASNAHESSWGCFCDNVMKLPCLGDCFSINWIVDSEKEDLRKETVRHQYQVVKLKTNQSHVMHYGDLTIGNDIVGEYLGEKAVKKKHHFGDSFDTFESEAWPSREIHLRMLEKQLYEAHSESEKAEIRHRIKKLYMKRDYFEAFFKSMIFSLVHDERDRSDIFSHWPHSIRNLNCHDQVTKAFHSTCFHFGHNPYAMKYVYVLTNLCNAGYKAERIVRLLFEKCMEIEIQGIY